MGGVVQICWQPAVCLIVPPARVGGARDAFLRVYSSLCGSSSKRLGGWRGGGLG